MSLTRRTFLGGAALASAWLVAGGRARAAPPSPPPLPSPRYVIDESPIARFALAQRSGQLTAAQLVQRYLERIAAVDGALRSVLRLNPAATAEAHARDAERRAGKVRGLLHGVPLLLKDNIDTVAGGMPTTAGSLALAGRVARRDAFLVERLRAAGAVILGKANLSEWADIRSSRSTSGWSAEGGQTRNPYALDRSPSGSSSGSGAAVAANLCAAAVGTETDGSILSPSSCMALVGVKPTVGLISRAGLIPLAPSQDTAGPMTRTVADAAILLGAMTGPDPRDPATARAPSPPIDYHAALVGAAGLRGARLGVPRKTLWGRHPAADRAGEAALAVLRAAGAELVEDVDIGAISFATEMEVLLYELKASLDAYLADAGAPVRSLADVIAFNEAHAAEELTGFGQELFLRAVRLGPLTDKAYLDARALCRQQARALDAAFTGRQLDALVARTNGPAWLIDPLNGDHFTGSSTTPSAVAGYPAITVPAGQERGLPLGLSFMGPAWSEARLLRYAHAFEQLTKARRPPDLRLTITQ